MRCPGAPGRPLRAGDIEGKAPLSYLKRSHPRAATFSGVTERGLNAGHHSSAAVPEKLVSPSVRIDITTTSGKMVSRMLLVLAEFEHDLVSERTKAALSAK